MADLTDGTVFFETDASNVAAANPGWPEGMPPSRVNDAARADQGAMKRAYDRDHAGTWCAVTGSGNAILLGYTAGPAAYVQGEKFSFKAIAANSGATSVNVSALGAKSVFKRSAAGVVACAGGEIQIGDIVELEYDGTQFQLLGSPAPGVLDATNGGIGISGGNTLSLNPSDLLVKAAPIAADSLVLMDSTAANAAKTVPVSGGMAASAATTLAGTDAAKWLTAAGFAGNMSIAGNGYYKLPRGLIVQWMTTASISGNSSATATFPLAFPTAVFAITGNGTGGNLAGINMGTVTLSSVVVWNISSVAQTAYVIAIGN